MPKVDDDPLPAAPAAPASLPRIEVRDSSRAEVAADALLELVEGGPSIEAACRALGAAMDKLPALLLKKGKEEGEALLEALEKPAQDVLDWAEALKERAAKARWEQRLEEAGARVIRR